MTLRASLALVAAAAAVLGALVGSVYGADQGLLTALLLAALGSGALVVAHAVAARRPRLGSLRRQLAVAGAIAGGQLVVAIGAGAGLMFVSGHDALLALVILALAALVGALTMRLLTRGVLEDVEQVRDVLVGVGEGERESAARTGGTDELAELARAANDAIAKLDEAERARRGLIAAVSHDLRTPITSLRLLTEAVDDEIVDGATRRRYLGQMRVHIAALSALIDDLFELSRLEAGDIRWTLGQVRLDALVDETVDAMRAQAEAKGVRVFATLPDGLEPARADPEKLQRVLFNLIQNAIRHTPADGSVTVLAEPAGDRVEIEVADTGDGIPPAEREHAFEPFFRGGAEAARTRSGAGLGLAIARAIVEAHGGRIWFEPSDRGTRVRFSLQT